MWLLLEMGIMIKNVKATQIGIAVWGNEGCSCEAMKAASIIVTGINQGLDLLLNPLRMKATLRF